MNQNLVRAVLLQPKVIASFKPSDWDLFVRQSRAANLLARFYILFQNQGYLENIPEQPRNHLLSASVIAEKQRVSVHWEVQCIHQAIQKTGFPFVLLKGAAYVMAGLPTAQGRIFSDIDILVSKEALLDVEKTLVMHGWHTTHHDEYDQQYYRKWMHELPPMQHIKRKSTLDLHHNILPETARLHPDPKRLIKTSIPVEGYEDVYVFAPVDMVLHSATHLFHDGELENGLRDLCDLDSLLTRFGKDENFWMKLSDRARELDLERPLFYALRFTKKILETSVPEKAFQASSSGRPNGFMLMVMDWLLTRALTPDHPSCEQAGTSFARWVLYIRSHFLRMPLHLLIPHLTHKAFRQKGAQ